MSADTYTLLQVWDKLQAMGPGPQPFPSDILSAADREDRSPWFVRLFAGLTAWVAAILLTGAILILGHWDVSWPMGLVLCAAALGLVRWRGAAGFTGQLALAISLVGTGLFAIGLTSSTSEWSGETVDVACWGVILLEALLLLTYPDGTRRFISVLLIYLALGLLIADSPRATELGLTLLAASSAALCLALWENDSRLQASRWRGLVAPIGFAVPLAALAIAVSIVGEWPEYLGILGIAADGLLREGPKYLWALSAAAGGLLIWLELRILRDVGIARTGPVALALLIVTALMVLIFREEPGVVLALLFLTLGLRRGRMTLAGLAVLCLIGFFSHYYYALSLTLLVKSWILMAAGALLLGARLLLRRLSPPGQAAATRTVAPGPAPEATAPGGVSVEPEEASS